MGDFGGGAALLWVGQVVGQLMAEKAFDRAVERYWPGQQQAGETGWVPERHDLRGGNEPTTEVDIVVRHAGSAAGTPVFLTFQRFMASGRVSDGSDGVIFPMVLGETAYVTLARAEYLIVALVVDLARGRGRRPVLRGLGVSDVYVASNFGHVVTIDAKLPTRERAVDLGLIGADGSGPFELAARPAAPVRAAGLAFPMATRSSVPRTCPARTVFGNRCGRFVTGSGKTFCRIHEFLDDTGFGVDRY
ncbi:hypothetical protein [Nocardia inohanensis]|uniref:hypothetical protein n=1 Tax=Nocardia inohanensis TaxID=209246 RepID=UPI00082E3EFD|nr:hypothetical protein [Nocardia inohanensis]